MHPANRSHWPIRDILAQAWIARCTLGVLATLHRPDAGFAARRPLVGGAVGVVVRHYFERRA